MSKEIMVLVNKTALSITPEVAKRKGNRWLWRRIKGLRQHMKKTGGSEEILSKLELLEKIILDRFENLEKARSIEKNLLTSLGKNNNRDKEIVIDLIGAQAHTKTWLAIAMFGQDPHHSRPSANNELKGKITDPAMHAEKIQKNRTALPKDWKSSILASLHELRMNSCVDM